VFGKVFHKSRKPGIIFHIFSEILQGIEEVAQANDYSLFMAASQRDPQRERAALPAGLHTPSPGDITASCIDL